MNRRETLSALLALGVVPLLGFAQQAGPSRTIGILAIEPQPRKGLAFKCLKEGLSALDRVEGRNLAIELRGPHGSLEQLPALARELIGLKPELIVAIGTAAAQAMQRATRDIPVVFATVSDPLASGIVVNLPRPEANVTGISNFLPATTSKLLEFARALVPKASRVAFLYDPANPGKVLELQVLRAAGRTLGVTIEPHALHTDGDIEGAFATMTTSPPDALIVPIDAVTGRGTARIVALAAKMRRPAIYQTRGYVDAGGLMSYGLDFCQHMKRAAAYVDRILKGAKPGDLPVEQPSTFELVINLRTAKALGISVPQSLLLRADQVIE